MNSPDTFFSVACALLASAVFLPGCASNEFPGPSDLPAFGDLPFVHRIDIQQGNVITQEMIAQLEFGMDKKKVTFIMGSPVILDTFHADRWDYLYLFKHGRGNSKRRRVTLYFEDSKLARIEGDVKPAVGTLVVDTRQDMTVDVPETSREGLMAKIKNTIPFVDKEISSGKSTAEGNKSVTLPDDEVPDFQAALKPAPVLTPVERAAVEEQGGPGVLAKIKEALPFSGDEEVDQTLSAPTSNPRAESRAKKTTAHEQVAGEEAAENGDSPSLLARLKEVMPFAKTEQEAKDPASESDTSTGQQGAKPSDRAALETQDESNKDAGSEEPAENLQETAGIDTVSAPPPGAPTAIPLENQLLDTPTRTGTARASADQDEALSIDVPAQKAPKKRGFFARLLGRDRPDEGSSEADRERRYRELADPEAN